MRSLLRSVVQRKEGGLVGRTLKVGPYTCKVEAHLGDGGFATIYRVRDNSGGAAYALKHIRLAGEDDARADCETEVETMKRLRGHPNILTLRAVAYTGPKGAEQEAFLLLDLCRDSLIGYMHERGGQLSDGDILTIFHSIAKAVAVMHHQSPPLAHRDLKAENVLLHSNGTWVLCDFGSASSWAGSYDTTDAILVAEEHIRKYTTPAYRAPEMFDLYGRVPITPSADLWALGVLLYLLCYGRLPFNGDCKLQVLNGEFSLPPGRPAQYANTIQGLLKVDPGARTDINEVLHRVERLAASLPQPPSEVTASRTPPAPANAPNDRQHAGTPTPAPAAPAAGSGCGSPAKAGSLDTARDVPSPVLWPRKFGPLAALEDQRSSSPDQAPGVVLGAPRSAHGTPAVGGPAAAGVQAVAALQQQLVSLSAANAELRATVDAQQDTIRRMQVEAREQAAIVRRLREGGACRPSQRGDACNGVQACLAESEDPASDGWVASFDSRGLGAPVAKATPGSATCEHEQASPAMPFDPFCIAEPSARAQLSGERNLGADSGMPAEAGGAARHRRTTSEPTSIDRWGPIFEV